MAKQITTQELKAKIDSGKEAYYLVDVLMQNSFEAKHIPTALNIPYEAGFLKEFEEKVHAPKDAQIIVYCASSGCQLSHMAQRSLKKPAIQMSTIMLTVWPAGKMRDTNLRDKIAEHKTS